MGYMERAETLKKTLAEIDEREQASSTAAAATKVRSEEGISSIY